MSFSEAYDSAGYRQTRVYPGMADGLRILADGLCQVFVVTTKRIVPTKRIIGLLGWQQSFAAL